jgi:hypothetical protein
MLSNYHMAIFYHLSPDAVKHPVSIFLKWGMSAVNGILDNLSFESSITVVAFRIQ